MEIVIDNWFVGWVGRMEFSTDRRGSGCRRRNMSTTVMMYRLRGAGKGERRWRGRTARERLVLNTAPTLKFILAEREWG